MTTSKRQRQKAGRQARLEAARAAQQRAKRNRTIRTVAIIAIVSVGGLFLFSALGGDGEDVATGGSTTVAGDTSTTLTGASAAGQPCVARANELPAGAPDVPVQVGPPPTQLVIQDLTEGTGDAVPAGATVTVNYIGVSCTTGTIFDESYSRGEPATFSLAEVIKGWTDGIPGMKIGGQRLLGIPADQAYGAEGRPPDILPDEPLWFVVELVSVQPAAG